MDAWDDDFREPTEDERVARRIIAVAIALINASAPLSTTELRREFYVGLSDAAFRKAFRRDRLRLAACGVVVLEGGRRDDEQTWLIDEDRSFARENTLTPEDALALDCLLLPLAADPAFPFAQDLRLALAKIDRSFDGRSTAALPPSARTRNRELARIEDCLVRRHAARVSYVRADGSKVERTLLPYGLFSLRDRTYVVAATKGSDQEPHTYLIDRMSTVREEAKTSYVIPPDFDVRDFVLLPFQVGSQCYTATFAVPEHRLADVRARVGERGQWQVDGGVSTLRISVSDERAASIWAIAEGVRPIEPETLVLTWRQRLERAGGGAGDER